MNKDIASNFMSYASLLEPNLLSKGWVRSRAICVQNFPVILWRNEPSAPNNQMRLTLTVLFVFLSDFQVWPWLTTWTNFSATNRVLFPETLDFSLLVLLKHGAGVQSMGTIYNILWIHVIMNQMHTQKMLPCTNVNNSSMATATTLLIEVHIPLNIRQKIPGT